MTETKTECLRAREAVTAIADIVRTAGESIPLQSAAAPRAIGDKPECARAVDVIVAVGDIIRAGQSKAPQQPPAGLVDNTVSGTTTECTRARETITAIADIVRTAGETATLQSAATRMTTDRPECARAVDVISVVSDIVRCAGEGMTLQKAIPGTEDGVAASEKEVPASGEVEVLMEAKFGDGCKCQPEELSEAGEVAGAEDRVQEEEEAAAAAAAAGEEVTEGAPASEDEAPASDEVLVTEAPLSEAMVEAAGLIVDDKGSQTLLHASVNTELTMANRFSLS